MRWIMNALVMSVCGVSFGSSPLLAQTPARTPEPAPAASPQRGETDDTQDQQATEAQRPAENNRGGRGAGRRPDGPGIGQGPRMMLARLPLMMALDADSDGEISPKEIEGAVAALKKLDKNSDGKLTMDELMPEGLRGPFGPGFFDPDEMVNRMMMADANNDGFIDQDEMPERMKSMMLDRADADKDGKLSKEELTKMVAQMGNGRGPGRPGQRGDRGDRPGEGNGSDQPERPRRPQSE